MSRILVGVAVVLSTVACSASPAPSTEPAPARPAPPENYALVFSISNPNGMGGGDFDAVYAFEVRDGQVVECEVSQPGPNAARAVGVCDQVTSPADYLFSWADRFDPEYTRIEYDPDTSLPLEITYDEPGMADEDYEIRVLEFDSKPDRNWPVPESLAGRRSLASVLNAISSSHTACWFR